MLKREQCLNNDNLKPFKYKGKLLQNRDADGARIILRNATVTLALKRLNNFLEITGDGIHLMQS